MAAITDILSIETEIITLLSGITGLNAVHRHPADGVDENDANPTALLVEFLGPHGGATAAGKNQIIATQWRVGVLADKDNYLAVAGVKMVDVMRAMLVHKPAEWIRPAKMVGPQEKAAPEFSGGLVFYPMVFEIEIVI